MGELSREVELALAQTYLLSYLPQPDCSSG